MTNRKERRTAAATTPKLEKVPNLSGTDEHCGNCRSARTESREKAMSAHGRNELKQGRPNAEPLPPGVVACLNEPGGGSLMHGWGWCSRWMAR